MDYVAVVFAAVFLWAAFLFFGSWLMSFGPREWR